MDDNELDQEALAVIEPTWTVLILTSIPGVETTCLHSRESSMLTGR
jgi:hypothetical protein